MESKENLSQKCICSYYCSICLKTPAFKLLCTTSISLDLIMNSLWDFLNGYEGTAFIYRLFFRFGLKQKHPLQFDMPERKHLFQTGLKLHLGLLVESFYVCSNPKISITLYPKNFYSSLLKILSCSRKISM